MGHLTRFRGMKLEKYDRLIWRTIGTLLMLGLIGGLGSAIFLSLRIFRDSQREPGFVRAGRETGKTETLTLGYFDPLLGTGLILIPLTSESGVDLDYSNRASSGGIRNYLLFNERTKTGKWIWKDNQVLMQEPKKIFDQDSAAAKRVLGLVFTTVAGNRAAAPKSIMYYDLGTGKPINICENVDRVVGIRQTDSLHVLSLYVRGGKAFAREFDLSSRIAGPESELAIPQ